MFLLDTMVVSDSTKTRKNMSVEAWVANKPPEALFVSAVTMGEVLFGVRRLPRGSRRERLSTWYREALTPFFANRVLAIDSTVADVWAGMRVQSPRTIAPIDGLIAATALSHSLTLVTRNERDFAGLGLSIVNPWV